MGEDVPHDVFAAADNVNDDFIYDNEAHTHNDNNNDKDNDNNNNNIIIRIIVIIITKK